MLLELQKRWQRLRRRTVRAVGRAADLCLTHGAPAPGRWLTLAFAALCRTDARLLERLAGLVDSHAAKLDDEIFLRRLDRCMSDVSARLAFQVGRANRIPEWDRRLEVLTALNTAHRENIQVASAMLAILPNGSPQIDRIVKRVRAPEPGTPAAWGSTMRWAVQLWKSDRAQAGLDVLAPFRDEIVAHWNGLLLLASLEYRTGNPSRSLELLEKLPRHRKNLTNGLHLELELMKASDALSDLGPVDGQRLEAVRARARRRIDEAPSADTVRALASIRSRLMDIRAACPSALRQGAGTALICPIHRPYDLENLLRQIERQACPEAEVVIAVNNTDRIDVGWLRDTWQPPMRKRILDLGAQPNIGTVLNQAIAATDAAFLVRMDADCLYLQITRRT